MNETYIITLTDVNGRPHVKISELPFLKIGDPIALKFKIERKSFGRHEVLEVDSQFRVATLSYKASSTAREYLLSVESIGRPPTWRSVKIASQSRPLAPARNPRTRVV